MKGTLLRLLVVACVVTSTAGVATALGAGSTSDADPAALDDPVRSDVEVNVSEPQSSDDFLAAFRELSGRESLSAYSEFEVIRTQAIVAVQSGEFESADRQRMRAVLRALVRFDAAYADAQNESLESSLRGATATRETLSGLESSGGAVYSSLANVALDRFFRSLGDRFEQRARSDGISTPAQIAAFRRASEAYRRGGSSDRFAEMSVRAEQLASAWERDSREINESVRAAQNFLERCGETCGDPIGTVTTHTTGVFGLYSEARTATAESNEAVQIAENNNLGDRTEELRALAEDSSSTLLSLAIGSALVFLAYALVLAVPTMFVAGRMSAWARDRRAASVGSILSPMPREVHADGGE